MDASVMTTAEAQAQSRQRRDIYSLGNGYLMVSWPSLMTAVEIEEALSLLEIIGRKIRRCVCEVRADENKGSRP